MRNLHSRFRIALEPRDTAWQNAEPGHFRRFVTPLEQPLHPEADPEQRRAASHNGSDRIAPRTDKRRRRGEVADARHDECRKAGELLRGRGYGEVGAESAQGLANRGEVAGAVIDQPNHSSPFVLGSIFANRASRAQATRSARANALNT